MALNPNNYSGQYRMQPGGRGETFQADLPGYRGQGDRINRTNTKLNASEHDVLNIKYQLDDRLPTLFRYGYAYGYNQIVIPRGRIVAADQHMDLVDFDMQHSHNTITLANGGVPVRLRQEGDVYPTFANQSETNIVEVAAQGKQVNGVGKEWTPLAADTYTEKSFDGFKSGGAIKQLTDAGLAIDADTGRVVDDAGQFVPVRPGNVPIGMIMRNEYTRDDDAFNGIMPGAVKTDALVELPWFAYKNKAEQNPWSSAYGNLFPGALLKSDENGRVTISPLSFEESVAAMTLQEYELERQQVIGQVYAASNDLLPEGAARFATWALEDRRDFVEFNPAVYYQNGRRGEDAVARSPFKSSNKYPGYPYDRAFRENDLHMNGGTNTLDVYSRGMNDEYQLENLGIPGLTDGKNVAGRTLAPVHAGTIAAAETAEAQIPFFLRTADVDVYDIQIVIGALGPVPVVEGAEITGTGLKVAYADNLQGIVQLEVADFDAFQTFTEGKQVEVKLGYSKRGLAGVPTTLDWDGAIGTIKVLLQK